MGAMVCELTPFLSKAIRSVGAGKDVREGESEARAERGLGRNLQQSLVQSIIE